MIKRILSGILAAAMFFSCFYAYAEDDCVFTEFESTAENAGSGPDFGLGSEENEECVNDIKEEVADENTEPEPEAAEANNEAPKFLEADEETVSIEICAAPVILSAAQALDAEKAIDTDIFTDDMSDNEKKLECENFTLYSELSETNAARFNDKTIMSFTDVGRDAWVTYRTAGSRVFTAASVTDYTRDGGKNAVLMYSSDGVSYTEIDSSVYKWTKVGSGGSGANDAGWSDKNQLEVSFDSADEVKFIKIYKSAETQRTKFKLGDITLTTTDPSVPKPDPEPPVEYGNEINTDSIADELDTDEYLFDKVNFKSYSEIAPNDSALFDDKSLLSFAEAGKEAYLIYKAAEGRVFTEFEIQNYTRDGGISAQVYISENGWDYEQADITWSRMGWGGSGANDAGWSDRMKTTKAINSDKGIRYIKILKSAESRAGKYKIGYVALKTEDISAGCVTGDVYEEQFDTQMYHVYKGTGISVKDKSFAAAGKSELIYKAMPKRELKRIIVTVEGSADWSGTLEAMDSEGSKIKWNTEIIKESEDNKTTLTADIPTGAAYVKLISNGAAYYTGIVVESGSAQGYEWIYVPKGNGVAFTVMIGGEPADTICGGCELSFSVPIKNAGSIEESGKAYLCVFEGDMMVRIEEFEIIAASGSETLTEGSITLDEVKDNTYVTLFLWTNLAEMKPIGAAAEFGKN